MKFENFYSPEDKLTWWGDGEWVTEPDKVTFEHQGIDCMVLRSAIEEPYTKEVCIFGGYLSGYISIPPNHPFYHKIFEKILIDCHGGLTFGECSDGHWIGFDCAHSNDYVPSIEHLKKTSPFMEDYRKETQELKKLYPSSIIWNKSYKNIQFCIDQCKSMAEQLIELGKDSKPDDS